MLEYNVLLYLAEGEDESILMTRVNAPNEETAVARAVFSLTTAERRGVDEINDVEVFRTPES